MQPGEQAENWEMPRRAKELTAVQAGRDNQRAVPPYQDAVRSEFDDVGSGASCHAGLAAGSSNKFGG